MTGPASLARLAGRRATAGRRDRSASCSACSRSSSRCRRSRCGRRSWPLLFGLLGDRGSGSGRVRARRAAGSAWGAVVARASSGSGSATSRRARASTHLDRVVVWSALFAAMLALRDAAHVRGDRRHVQRAQRRREHRPRGDDADGRVLRDPRCGQARLLAARAPRRAGRGSGLSRSSTRSSRSTCAPTRSSAGRRSTSSRSASPATSSSTSTADQGTPGEHPARSRTSTSTFLDGLGTSSGRLRPAQPDDLARFLLDRR